VTSDTPPQRGTLGDAAVLVPPGNPAALAAALLGLAGDRSELARMRRLARQLAGRRFMPEQVVAPLVERLQAAGGTSPAAQPSRQAQPLR
jgi:glycosyltransferase involved in cell wall biosynthesis